MLERSEFVFVGALFMFALAFVLSGILPILALNKVNPDYMTFEALAKEASPYFQQLAQNYPEPFKKYYGEVNEKSYATALRDGRDAYIAEACWHCHSQYIRPVSKESERWGPVSEAEEYNNALSMPPLWGTRRVGPDLSREKGVRSNDWHMAHLWQPSSTSPGTVMPSYRWFFDGPGKPGKRAIAIVTYLQWLGTTRNQVRQHNYPTAEQSQVK